MTIADKLKSFSLLIGDFSAMTHFTSIKQSLNVVGEKASVLVGDEALISVIMSEPVVIINVDDTSIIHTSIIENDLSVVIKENDISIIKKDNVWQVLV